MKLLIDNQLPARLSLFFRSRGHDCAHVLDLKLDEAKDVDLWTSAAREELILMSKDEDFVYLANRPGDKGHLIWVRLGNCRNDACMRHLNASTTRCSPRLVRASELLRSDKRVSPSERAAVRDFQKLAERHDA
jgi:predicted nuclease of predicted toxin-antitoxin system